jgi:hypothetical protein
MKKKILRFEKSFGYKFKLLSFYKSTPLKHKISKTALGGNSGELKRYANSKQNK